MLNQKLPAQLFALIALLVGLIYLVITPPCQSPDEQFHFYKGWQVSKGQMYAQKTFNNRLGGNLPESLSAFTEPFLLLKQCPDCKTSAKSIISGGNIGIKPEQTKFMDFANTGFYAPVGYLSQALAYTIARFADLPIGVAFYLGRLFNFLVWFILIYKAIQIAIGTKWLIFFIACLPASLAFHISLNPDVLAHGLGFLFLAYVFNEAKGQLHPHFSTISSILLLLITLIKPTFLPLGLLYFMIPEYRFGTTLKKIFHIFLLCLPALVSFFMAQNISDKLMINYDDYHPKYRISQTLQPNANTDKQLRFITSNPFHVSGIFVESIVESLPSTLAHYTGKFGWEHHYLPRWLIAALLIGILLSTQTRTILFDPSQKLLLIFTFLTLILLFCVAMYMLWSPVGHRQLLNLQGRYFVLIFPLAWLVIPVFRLPKSGWIQFLLILILLIAQIYMVGMMLNRYYIL